MKSSRTLVHLPVEHVSSFFPIKSISFDFNRYHCLHQHMNDIIWSILRWTSICFSNCMVEKCLHHSKIDNSETNIPCLKDDRVFLFALDFSPMDLNCLEYVSYLQMNIKWLKYANQIKRGCRSQYYYCFFYYLM